MNPELRALLGLTSLTVLILASGCGSDAAAPADGTGGTAAGLMVSSPFKVSGEGPVAIASRGSGSVAYVSMVPGSVPKGASLSVRNLNSGATAAAFMMDGGADPVEIDASAGHELSIIVTDSTGHSTTSTEAVKQRRPPRVVRTQPIRGSVDVPLNVRVGVVFSGPIDSTTAGSDAITVLQGGKVVLGQASLSSDGLTLSWTSSSPLAVATSYVVVLSQAIEDRNGFPVSGFEPVDFTTGASMEADYGSLQVIIRTSGTPVRVLTNPAVPTSAWELRVGALTPFRVEPEDTVFIDRIPAGTYDLGWTIAPNCGANAAMPVQATVTAGSTSHVAAIFMCAPWTAQLKATIVSDGESVPSDYQLILRSSGYVTVIAATIPANGSAVIPLPEPGRLYMASLISSNDQCRMTPGTREVTPGPGGVASVEFKIMCGAPTAINGSIEITTRTIGAPVTSELWEPLPMKVTLMRDSRQVSLIVLPNDTLVVKEYATLDYLVAGQHTVVWSQMPANCAGGPEPGPFSVVDGKVSHVTLTASCAAWTGRLQINTTLDGPNYGPVVFRITGGGLPEGAYPQTFIWPGAHGTVPLPPGNYAVEVVNGYFCGTKGDNPQHVTVGASTAVVSFAIVCGNYWE